jgi:hypothetical protein
MKGGVAEREGWLISIQEILGSNLGTGTGILNELFSTDLHSSS